MTHNMLSSQLVRKTRLRSLWYQETSGQWCVMKDSRTLEEFVCNRPQQDVRSMRDQDQTLEARFTLNTPQKGWRKLRGDL